MERCLDSLPLGKVSDSLLTSCEAWVATTFEMIMWRQVCNLA